MVFHQKSWLCFPTTAASTKYSYKKQQHRFQAEVPLRRSQSRWIIVGPNAVVEEKTGNDSADINAQRISALRHFVTQLRPEAEEGSGSQADDTPEHQHTDIDEPINTSPPKVQRLAIMSGSQMIDQFTPWYFGVAFAFVFKFCTGMPDGPAFMEQERYRRGRDAPRIEIGLWARTMARRVEAQLCRDWHFGFVTWNYLFRTSINLSRTVMSYETKGDQDGPDVTAKILEEGAICLFRALGSTYKDMNGRTQSVKGDMTKLRYVPSLTVAAKR